jgi:hypothetical protein
MDRALRLAFITMAVISVAVLIFLWGALLSGCAHPTPVVAPPAPTVPHCGPALGKYKLTIQGAMPDPRDPEMARIEARLCPADVFMGYKDSTVLELTAKDAASKCGTCFTADKASGMAMVMKVTNTGMGGYAVMVVALADELSCLAFFNLKSEKV